MDWRGRCPRVTGTQLASNRPLPAGNTAAALVLSDNRRHLYVSHRGADTIVAFDLTDPYHPRRERSWAARAAVPATWSWTEPGYTRRARNPGRSLLTMLTAVGWQRSSRCPVRRSCSALVVTLVLDYPRRVAQGCWPQATRVRPIDGVTMLSPTFRRHRDPVPSRCKAGRR
jgi:Lactonase, 7-bladed beta-propeller